ncbi:hydroxypyruvate isomerase family protein [Methylomicrobium sp. RS1]|jgi:hydroxypyruvate isomerase|uniref:hydroxypyruvate isomerase family protein n=1 Tax=Candidatus Methylomicrobium oryzae TaxID=2802053 RepID=UPI001922F2BD|nr:TIM barrel protein [Methylomicrobium sp. RS1]MBL1265597.1 TIM barrel protein [Methylomicrobium sp. RS1]
MPRFSANLSMLFTEVELIDRFAAARAAGFNAVEIQFPYELEAEPIRRKLNEYDLQLVLFNVPADGLLQGGEGLACVPEKQARFREALALAVEYAKVLQPPAINVLPGRCLDPSRIALYLDTFKRNLCLAADAFTPLGIKTVFEAINSLDMPGFIIDTSAKMLAVQDELQRANICLQYDIYHMLRMGEDPAAFIAKYAGRIGHIQFADCPGRGQPGTGSADWAALFSAIDSSAYDGWVGAEYKPVGDTSASLGWLNHSR